MWDIALFGLLILLIIGFLIIMPFLGKTWEVRIFNEAYNTNYTVWEWMFARETIRDYIGVGKKQRLGIELP